ncbi:MAG: hypothetical protein Kow0067_16460 [Coriobacteriia bacterium]|nr:hypothetical protein [Anaerosomatales bacterium]
MSDLAAETIAAPRAADSARWPYALALGALLAGAAGFVYAPISGIVYVVTPASVFGAYWALRHRSPGRWPLVASAILFFVGFVVGAASLAFMPLANAADAFMAGELGFVVFALALVAMPAIALAAGIAGAVLGLARAHREGTDAGLA